MSRAESLETNVGARCVKAPSSHPTPNNWFAVFVCVFSGVVCALQIAKLSIAAPFLVDDLGLDRSAIGALGSIFSLLGMIGGIPIATVALRTGLKRSVLIGMLAISICSFLPPLFPDLWLLCGLRVIEGLGFILVTVAAPTLVQAQVQLPYKNIAMSFWSCFMPIGIAFMMFGGTLFCYWLSIWFANGLIAASAFFFVLLYVPSPLDEGAPLSFKQMKVLLLAVLKTPAALRIALIFSCYNLMYFAFYNFLPLLIVEKLQLSHFFAGIITGCAAIANIFGNLAAGLLLSKGASRRQVFTAAFIMMSFMGWFIFSWGMNPWWVGVAAVLFAGTGGMLPTAVLSSAPVVAPMALAIPITLGLYMQGSNLGQVLGPLMTGLGTEHFGWSAAGPVFILLGLAGLGLVLLRRLSE